MVNVVSHGVFALIATAADTAIAQEHVSKVLHAPVKVAFYPDRPPLMFHDHNQHPEGAVIDLWRKWAQVNHTDVEFIPVITFAYSVPTE